MQKIRTKRVQDKAPINGEKKSPEIMQGIKIWTD